MDDRRFSKTLGGGTKEHPISHWGKGAPRYRTSADNWKQPLKWNRAACAQHHIIGCEECQRQRVFCASLSDWLDDEVPIEWLADLLKLIHATPNLDWLLLSKRPENWTTRMHMANGHLASILDLEALDSPQAQTCFSIADWVKGKSPSNVWIGTSVESEEYAKPRLEASLQIPAKVHFVSHEPGLGPVNFRPYLGPGKLVWGITGGESETDDSQPRPYYLNWAEDFIRQFREHGAAPFVKQMGAHCVDLDAGRRVVFKHPKGEDPSEWPEHLRVQEFPEVLAA